MFKFHRQREIIVGSSIFFWPLTYLDISQILQLFRKSVSYATFHINEIARTWISFYQIWKNEARIFRGYCNTSMLIFVSHSNFLECYNKFVSDFLIWWIQNLQVWELESVFPSPNSEQPDSRTPASTPILTSPKITLFKQYIQEITSHLLLTQNPMDTYWNSWLHQEQNMSDHSWGRLFHLLLLYFLDGSVSH